jgi:exopolysaccharide biosynthesis predicted pyruvyltransferase EpsI
MTMVMTESRPAAQDLVRSLKAQVGACLGDSIAPGPVALVDFPAHSNVGDSAIWLGEMAWLDEAGRTPVYSCDLDNFSEEKLVEEAPSGPILIHGGGNFGTTWIRHEELRLHLLRRFRNRPIVQMPQSIFYDDPGRAAEMARAIGEHGNFTLLVRDATSLAFAERHFDCVTKLCPDAALYLGCSPRQPSKADILALLRTDHEAVASSEGQLPSSTIVQDWLEESRAEQAFMRARLKLESLLPITGQDRRLRRYRFLAASRLRRGFSILSQGRVVVTDRLHAHILSLLLDIPHVAMDNSYGKLSAFAAHWTGTYRGFHRATSRREAFQIAQDLVGRNR